MKVLVSLTTTNTRLGLLFYTFQSLQRQSYRHFNIVVNISKEPYLFDSGIIDSPDWLAGDNVIVNYVKNSGSYRKLLPLINEIAATDLIITADDDVLYAEDWLSKIVDNAMRHSESIICGRARTIKKNIFGFFQNYANWSIVDKSQHGMDLIPIGCAGVAYRKELLDLNFLNDEVYAKLAPTADDIWFRLASLRKHTKVFIEPNIENGCIYMQHTMGLQETNIYKNPLTLSLVMRIILRLLNRFRNYIGKSMSKNDYSWKNANTYSHTKVY